MKCYEICTNTKNNCKNAECRQWIKLENHQNCTIIAASEGQMSLQDIGNILGVSRMRICQIEKKIIQKLNEFIAN